MFHRSLAGTRAGVVIAGMALVLLGAATESRAHCDSLDGPIIPEAAAALDSGNLIPVLKWVRAEDEPAIREAFGQARALRVRGEDIRQLADRHFLETLIRIHRQGEGEPYTGLKAAGHIDPALAAADAALETGDVDQLAGEISAAVNAAIHERFAAARAARPRANLEVEAGRRYVEAYVHYIHYVEGLHAFLAQGAQQGGAPGCGAHAD